MVRMGIAEPSDSAYASPVVIVRKKDGSVRFCVDYRKLNAVTIFDPEPIPNIEDLMSTICEGRYFTKIDLTKGYWQIPMAERDKHKTAFVTPDGHYQFNVLPFGMVNAPAVFTRMMRRLLNGISNVVNYIDDILLFTGTWLEHVKLLQTVLKRLQTEGITARPSKCFVAYESVDFLGFNVGEGMLKPQQEKIDKIMKVRRPETKKEVRSFVGLVNFYRKFIPNCGAILAPLTDLTKRGASNKVSWGEAQENAFKTLKSRLENPPILHLPDASKTYVLRTDASDVGIGAVLSQEENGQSFPVYYASKKLLPRERTLAVIERECLALIWAVKKFSCYLHGREFILETDHQPLVYINRAKMQNDIKGYEMGSMFAALSVCSEGNKRFR